MRIPVRGTRSDYQISFSLKPSGAQKFGEWTGKSIGKYLAIVLNDQVKSAPYIKAQIFDQGTYRREVFEDLG